jgi:hypothetical protein
MVKRGKSLIRVFRPDKEGKKDNQVPYSEFRDVWRRKINMVKNIGSLLLIVFLLFTVGCTAEFIAVGEATSTAKLTEAYPAAETTEPGQTTEAYPPEEESATAEAPVDAQPTNTPKPITTDTPVPEEVLQLQPVSPKKDPLILKNMNLARTDLAGKLGISLPSTEIKVVAYEEVIWRDSSLGCPEPEMMYAQGMVDGYVIQLQVGDQTFNYHGAKGEKPFLCPESSGLELEPLPGDDTQIPAEEAATESNYDAQAQELIDLAKTDLMNTLGVELSTIELVSYEEVTWNDGSLGCPQPDMMYTQALVDGYLIQLQVGDQVFNYHGANGGEPFLCSN